MSLPAYFETHRTDIVRETYWLVEIRFPVVQRLTNAPEPIVYSTNTFNPFPLKVEGITTDNGGPSSGSGGLTIGAADNYWSTLLAALAEDERHPEIVFYEAAIDPAAATWVAAAVRTVAARRLISATWNPTEAKLTLGPSADAKVSRIPFREYGSGTCTVRRFKGAQCGYAGAATVCGNGVAPERTYEACTALSNQARFCGFRQIPKEEGEITWEWNAGSEYRTATITLRRRDE